MNLPEAIAELKLNLKNDAGYRQGWKANIAMAMYDELEASLEISITHAQAMELCNRAADRFLQNLENT